LPPLMTYAEAVSPHTMDTPFLMGSLSLSFLFSSSLSLSLFSSHSPSELGLVGSPVDVCLAEKRGRKKRLLFMLFSMHCSYAFFRFGRLGSVSGVPCHLRMALKRLREGGKVWENREKRRKRNIVDSSHAKLNFQAKNKTPTNQHRFFPPNWFLVDFDGKKTTTNTKTNTQSLISKFLDTQT